MHERGGAIEQYRRVEVLPKEEMGQNHRMQLESLPMYRHLIYKQVLSSTSVCAKDLYTIPANRCLDILHILLICNP